MASAFQTRYKYLTGRPFTRTERNVTTGTRVRYSPTGFYLSVRFRGGLGNLAFGQYPWTAFAQLNVFVIIVLALNFKINFDEHSPSRK